MFLIPSNNKKVFNINSMIDEFFNDAFLNNFKDTMKVDVRENEKEYLIEADLPGVNREAINLEFNDGYLTISVNQEEQKGNEQDQYIYRERRMSQSKRVIYLEDASKDGITAKLENGDLKISALKVVQPNQNYRIEIK